MFKYSHTVIIYEIKYPRHSKAKKLGDNIYAEQSKGGNFLGKININKLFSGASKPGNCFSRFNTILP